MDWFCWENLNRKPWFLPSNWSGFPVNFPIIQFYEQPKKVWETIYFPHLCWWKLPGYLCAFSMSGGQKKRILLRNFGKKAIFQGYVMGNQQDAFVHGEYLQNDHQTWPLLHHFNAKIMIHQWILGYIYIYTQNFSQIHDPCVFIFCCLFSHLAMVQYGLACTPWLL